MPGEGRPLLAHRPSARSCGSPPGQMHRVRHDGRIGLARHSSGSPFARCRVGSWTMYVFDRRRRLPRLRRCASAFDPVSPTRVPPGSARIAGPAGCLAEGRGRLSTGWPDASLEVLSPSALAGPCCAIRSNQLQTIPLRRSARLVPRPCGFPPGTCQQGASRPCFPAGAPRPERGVLSDASTSRGRGHMTWPGWADGRPPSGAPGVRPFAALLRPARRPASPPAPPHLPLPDSSRPDRFHRAIGAVSNDPFASQHKPIQGRSGSASGMLHAGQPCLAGLECRTRGRCCLGLGLLQGSRPPRGVIRSLHDPWIHQPPDPRFRVLSALRLELTNEMQRLAVLPELHHVATGLSAC